MRRTSSCAQQIVRQRHPSWLIPGEPQEDLQGLDDEQRLKEMKEGRGPVKGKLLRGRQLPFEHLNV